jgi:hypothetical protein
MAAEFALTTLSLIGRMLRPLASIWDIVVPPTAILTTVVVTAIATIVTAVIVIVVAVFLASTGIVTVIPMVVIAVTATAIGARLPPVVIRPIIAGAEAIPEVHPEAVALLVRQGTSMPPVPPKTPIIGNFSCLRGALFACFGIRTNVCGGTRLKCCKREEDQCSSPITQVCFPFSPYYNSSQSVKFSSSAMLAFLVVLLRFIVFASTRRL